MSLRSSEKDHFINKLEVLQQNLSELVAFAKTSYSNADPFDEEAIFNLTEEVFFALDNSGGVLKANKAALALLNYQIDELLGLNFVDLVPILEKKKCREHINKVSLGFPSVSFSVRIVNRIGEQVHRSFKFLKKGDIIYALGGIVKDAKTPEATATDLSDTVQEPLPSTPPPISNDETQETIDGMPFSKMQGPETAVALDGAKLRHLKDPAIMSTVDVNGFIVDVNAKWSETLGYSREEVLGREAFCFFDNESRKRIADDFIPEIATTGSAKVEKCLMVKKDGSAVEVALSGALSYSSVQRIFKWLIFIKNDAENGIATSNNGSEANVLHSTPQINAIINSSKQILFLVDKKMFVTAFNKHAEAVVARQTGRTLKIGDNILSFLGEEDAKGLKEIYEEVLMGRSVHFTREMHWPKNGKRWFEVNLFPVEDEHIHINNVVFCAEDITERKLAEEKFKELEINFKSIFTQVAVGVMLLNLENEVVQANKRFYDLVEYSKEEFEEVQLVGVTHPEDREKSLKYAEQLTNGEIENCSFEKRYVTKSGRIVWVYLTATVVKNMQGKLKSIISVAQDITLRKTAEQELLYKKSELDTFVYRASHDLRGPVASLMGLYNIVKVEFAHDKNAITYFEHYNNSVMRLHAVLQNLIDLTKIKESETKLTQVDLKALIESCLDTLKNLPDFHRIAISVEVDINFKVFIDSKRIKTIIKNLVENAIIYATPENTAFVKIFVSYQENVLKIEVVDNGRGIDPRIQSKVFNMFFRGTEKSKGSGLGLYIVKNAVEKLNGSIQVNSTLNEGTRFSVYIPYLYEQEYSALLEKNFVN